jgi:phosphoribosylformylglycinamidine cyclo-ligase
VFQWLAERANLRFEDAAVVWNMGIGYVVIVDRTQAERAMTLLEEYGETAYRIGEVVEGKQEVVWGETI